MKLNKKIQIILFILTFIFIFTFESIVLAYYPDTEYVWSENTVPTSSETTEGNSDFLELSCESAILIEQNSRFYNL